MPPSTYGTATYTFDKLLPGTYDLQATWTGGASRTSGAVYSWEIETAADAPQKVSLGTGSLLSDSAKALGTKPSTARTGSFAEVPSVVTIDTNSAIGVPQINDGTPTDGKLDGSP